MVELAYVNLEQKEWTVRISIVNWFQIVPIMDYVLDQIFAVVMKVGRVKLVQYPLAQDIQLVDNVECRLVECYRTKYVQVV